MCRQRPQGYGEGATTPASQAGTPPPTDLSEDPIVTMTHPQSTSVPARPAASDRVVDLLGAMVLEEKLAQIVGFWDKGDGEAVAPLQGDFTEAGGLDHAARHG